MRVICTLIFQLHSYSKEMTLNAIILNWSQLGIEDGSGYTAREMIQALFLSQID